MSDESRIPTAKVVITIYDRDVEVEGDNLAMLKNSTIHRIELMLKRAARKAKRTVIRESRVEPTEKISSIQTTEIITKNVDDSKLEGTEEKKPNLTDSLAKLGIKLKTDKSEG